MNVAVRLLLAVAVIGALLLWVARKQWSSAWERGVALLPQELQEGLPESVDAIDPVAQVAPESSIARTETDVISFQDVLRDENLSQRERIEALQRLDPGALRARVAPPAVAGPEITERPRANQGAAGWELASARRKVGITMYSTTWCGVCTRARDYFTREGIAFVEHDIDANAAARSEYLRLNPRRSVPTIKIDDEVVVGFSPGAVQAAIERAARKRVR